MKCLVDGDICIYRVGWTTENDDFPIARFRVDEMLDSILVDTDATEFEVWLSDSAENNFRYKIYPEYKANRKDVPRPRHLEALKEYLITKWSARIALGQEADDALGIGQYKEPNSLVSTICSIDKDLQQIPGNHYNFVKKEHNFVSPEQGIKTFYKQILVGDVADNISGCKGIGRVRAERIIEPLRADHGILAGAVLETYLKAFGVTNPEATEEIINYIEKVGSVLKIRQKEGEELWRFPREKLTAVLQSSFIQAKQAALGPSTEPISVVNSGSPLLGEKTVAS